MEEYDAADRVAREAEEVDDVAELDAEPTDDANETEDAIPEEGDDGDQEDLDPEADDWRQRYEQAEEARRSMERDYRIKTHRIAQAAREIKAAGEPLLAVAQTFRQLSDQNVAQFQNIDWDALKKDPSRYSAMTRQFEAATLQQRQLHQLQQNTAAEYTQAIEKAQEQQAEVSREILRTTLGENWSEAYFNKLAEYAQDEFGLTREEFDDIVDWRHILPIHKSFQADQAPKVVRKTVRTQGRAPAGAQRETPQVKRNVKGQFQNAKQVLWDNPGDRQARRDFFQNKLRAERGR
jgi:hypothetical protein